MPSGLDCIATRGFSEYEDLGQKISRSTLSKEQNSWLRIRDYRTKILIIGIVGSKTAINRMTKKETKIKGYPGLTQYYQAEQVVAPFENCVWVLVVVELIVLTTLIEVEVS